MFTIVTCIIASDTYMYVCFNVKYALIGSHEYFTLKTNTSLVRSL